MEQGFQTKVERSWDQNQGSALKIGEMCCMALSEEGYSQRMIAVRVARL